MNKSPAYQWYPKDALSSSRIALMSAEVECWYRRALDVCWLDDSLPNDPATVAVLIGKGCTVEGAKAVLTMFVPHPKDASRLVNLRQEIEWKKQRQWKRKSAAGGKKSGEARRKAKEAKELEAENETKGGSEMVEPKTNIPIPISSSSSKDKKNISAAPKKPKKQLTGYPDDFALTADMREWFAANCPRLNADAELEKFKNRCLAKGTEYKDWVAGWRTQMLNAEDWYKPETLAAKNEPKVICTQMNNFNDIPWVPVRHAGVVDDAPKPEETYSN